MKRHNLLIDGRRAVAEAAAEVANADAVLPINDRGADPKHPIARFARAGIADLRAVAVGEGDRTHSAGFRAPILLISSAMPVGPDCIAFHVAKERRHVTALLPTL